MRPVGVADFEAVLVLDDLRRLAAEVDGEPAVAHFVGDALTEVGVEATQQPLAAVGERGLDAEPLEDRGELERDVAAADDQRALRQLLQVERLVRADGVLATFDRRHDRPRTRGDQDVLGAVALAIDFHFVRREHRGATADDFDARRRQHALIDAVQARDLLVLVGEECRPVEAGFAGGPAVRLGDFELLAPVGGVGRTDSRRGDEVRSSEFLAAPTVQLYEPIKVTALSTTRNAA